MKKSDERSVSVRAAARTAMVAEKQALKEHEEATASRAATIDSFQNLAQNLGVGGDNPLTTASYGFNPMTRQRVTLEWMHRGSWLAGQAVDLPAEDMTREGVTILGDTKPQAMERIEEEAETLGIWTSLAEGISWGRLYGGSIAVMLVDGQDESTPLRMETIEKEQFRGLAVFDRWMVEPSMGAISRKPGQGFGQPEFYSVRSDTHALRGARIHQSRCIRFVGTKLPFWQTVIEQYWGASVLERLWDRMIAFDGASTGAAQLAYKAWIRTLKLKNFRTLVASGGKAQAGVVAQLHFMRRYGNSEGFSVIDAEDEMDTLSSPPFSGLRDVILSMGEQVSGALQIPLVRLFGQSPSGLNATGDSDLRIYADNVRKNQNRDLKPGVTRIYRALAMSTGYRPPDGFGVKFNPLYQLTDKEKGEVGQAKVTSIMEVWNSGLISEKVALSELKQISESTGLFSNITAKDIAAAEEEPPPTAPGLAVAEANAEGGDEGDAPAGEAKKGAEKKDKAKGAEKKTDKKKPANDALHVVAEMKRRHDIEVVIESKKGEVRRGPGWEVFLPDDYGYIRGTMAPDKEQVDCYVGLDPSSERVWVVNQTKLDGTPDEPKVLLGYPTLEAGMKTYITGFSDGLGWQRVGGVANYSMPEFKQWLATQGRPS